MLNEEQYDCAIIGGGVSGLCLSILLARSGRKVILFEKNSYPFNKVCGEYISNESYDFLVRLGLPLDEWDLPRINTLVVNSQKGFSLNAKLPLGGFGLSRYLLDYEMSHLARRNGVCVMEQTKVYNVDYNCVFTNNGRYNTKLCVGAFGKASPVFASEKKNTNNKSNFVAVKYHIKTDLPSNKIELNLFKNGYCGLSQVERYKFCLCYIANAKDLRYYGGNIAALEENVLMKNPRLNAVFRNSEFVNEGPVTISNVKFGERTLTNDKLIYLGDAAGCISPLTGNGISMAAHASYILSGYIESFLNNEKSLSKTRYDYQVAWRATFLKRIQNGKRIQKLSGLTGLSHLLLKVLNSFEGLKSSIISNTHGHPF
jgi:menaquinone-9 beta-reductase